MYTSKPIITARVFNIHQLFIFNKTLAPNMDYCLILHDSDDAASMQKMARPLWPAFGTASVRRSYWTLHYCAILYLHHRSFPREQKLDRQPMCTYYYINREYTLWNSTLRKAGNRQRMYLILIHKSVTGAQF